MARRGRERKRVVKEASSRREYQRALESFDIAVCEAKAVGQAQAGRLESLNVGWGSYIFARMCAHATLMIRAAPLNRWIHSSHEDWDFASVAGHARALLEGYLFFEYMIEPPVSDDEMKARVNVMHLNDCTKRLEIMLNIGEVASAKKLAKQRQELQGRLRSNPYFTSLEAQVQKACLQGKKPWFRDREQLLKPLDMSKAHFDVWWTHLSQHAHILPLSFYRMEPNGRGTGIENDTDRGYIKAALDLAAEVLAAATNRMVEVFPDTAAKRRGLSSVFSPGPADNAPIQVHGAEVDFDTLQHAIKDALSRRQ